MTDIKAAEICSFLQKGLARDLNFSECLAELQSIFGTECPSRETVLDWYEAVTLDNVKLVKKLIEEDPKMTRQQIKARLNIGGAVVRSILRDRLGLRKIGNRWVIRKSVEEDGGDKNADVSNGICVKQENDFQIKSEVENDDLSENKEEFDDENNVTLDMKTPVIEDFVVKNEIVDKDLEHQQSDDLKYLCMDNAIKEEPIDIFDEHIELDAQVEIEQENDEFTERLESKDELEKRRKKRHLSIEVKSAIILTSDNRYACKYCFKSYKRTYHAYRHVADICLITERRFKCKMCDRNFTAKASLKRHMLFLHTSKDKLPKRKKTEEEVNCDKCNRRYRDKHSLQRHEKYECGQEPRFSCAHCDYRSLQKINLVRHLARAHAESEITRISCPKCDKSYKNNCSLKRHLTLECGKEPAFACDMCGFRTKRKSSLASHVQIKHLNKKKRAYLF